MASRFVEIHGGILRIASAEGKGTEVEIVLPIEAEGRSSPLGTLLQPEPRSTSSISNMYSVLIVEDHDRLREQLGQFYEQEGFKVTTAACGEEGIEKLSQEKFAIVVSDVKMPGIDGFQLARHVREKYPDTDVILITAFGTYKTSSRSNETRGKRLYH